MKKINLFLLSSLVLGLGFLSSCNEQVKPKEKELTSIQMEVTPKTVFAYGEDFTYEGASIRCLYNDESYTIKEVSEDMIDIPSMNKESETVYIHYFEFVTSYTIHVDINPPKKEDVSIHFSFENGDEFFIGDSNNITVTVTPKDATFISYFELNEINIGKSEPTSEGDYALICEVQESEKYNAKREFRWFRLKQKSSKILPEVIFYFESGSTFVIGEDNDLSFAVTPEDAKYVSYYQDENDVISETMPNSPGSYSLVVEVEESETIQYFKTWCVFKLVLPSSKIEPTITFSIENGHTFYLGDMNSILVEVEPNEAEFITYYEKDEVNIGNSFPSESGTYAFICEVKESENIQAKREFRWFNLVDKGNRKDAIVYFSFENGAEFVIGQDNEISVIVQPSEAKYITYFEKDEVDIGKTFPTEPGDYSFIVEVLEDENINYTREWRWFRLIQQ